MSDIVDQLRSAIQESGMTQAKLSEHSGVPQPTISRFVREERTITFPVAAQIADALGMELRYVWYSAVSTDGGGELI